FYYAASTPDTYTLSLHDALPISSKISELILKTATATVLMRKKMATPNRPQMRSPGQLTPEPSHRLSAFASSLSTKNYAREVFARSEEHTSELQSLRHLVCRLLLE